MRLLALAAAALLSAPASAIMPSREDGSDARRFRLDALSAVGPRLSADGASRPLRDYNRTSRRGMGPAALAAGAAAPAGPREAADAFLRDRGAAFGLDWTSLVFEKASDGGSHKHALYRQTHRGLPVEFSRVKVHFDGSWAVTGVDSDYDSSIDVGVGPSATEMEARAAALADAGGGSAARAELVVLTDPARQAPARLAWRTRVTRGAARWRYWIDAHTREVALRVSDVRQLGPCGEKGVVQGMVYPLDPDSVLTGESAALVAKPFAHQRVFVGDGSQWADTQLDTDPGGEGVGLGRGFYCSSAIGKVFTQLQGPYVNVASFIGPSAHYDNGAGTWSQLGTPVSSPHPYQNGTTHTSTISLAGFIAPGAVKFLPVFTNLDVGAVTGGEFGEGSNIADNDEVQIVDKFDRVVASYVGSRGAFKGTAVPGTLMRIRMKANESSGGLGYDVSLSSYLVLTAPFTSAAGNGFAWTTTHTASGLRGEIQLFYHLNEMRDFLAGVAGTAGAARYLSGSVNAMVHAGPNLINAQYEPSTDNLFFGDVSASAPSDVFVEDATVPRHEYTHYFVEKIFSPQNFGQAGAISEAVADYFSLTSFGAANISSMGDYVGQSFELGGPLRELDCPAKTACKVLTNTSWVGEIHDDSIYVSQALWDIRRDRIAAQGAAAGQACVDGLVYQSLLYFPESFQELLTAMLRVDAANAVPVCGGASVAQAAILSRFGTHGINLPAGSNDPYDAVTSGQTILRNDGFETAVDVTTIPAFGGTIYPSADLDFFSFGSGPGPIQARLELPADVSGFHKAYFLTLFDSAHRIVAEAHPPYDGVNTLEGLCDQGDCTTTASFVELNYNAARGELYYLQVSGGPTAGGASNSGVNSVSRYSISLAFPRPAAFSGAIVSAEVDRDVVSFEVRVTSWPHNQDWRFAKAQLRDHAQAVIPGAATEPASAASFLTLLTVNNANGRITGTVRLQNSFSQRFPSLGTVHLEVFGYNVYGSTSSLGLSNPIALTTTQSEARAWNNVFNPALGQKTTIKYDLLAAGRLRMRLYTLNGQLISTLFDGEAPAGKGAVDWAGRNFVGSVVASGVYLLRVEGPNVDKTIKVAVVK